MSDSNAPVLFKVLKKAEEKGGYTRHLGLHEVYTPTPSCVAIKNANKPVDAAGTPTSNMTSNPTESSSRKRALLDMVRKPLRGNGTGILINTVDSTTSKRSESVIVNSNRSLVCLPTVAKRKFSLPRQPSISRSLFSTGSAATPRDDADDKKTRFSPTVIFTPCSLSSAARAIDTKNCATPAMAEKFAVCSHCGTTSTDFKICDSCHRHLGKPKEYEPKAADANTPVVGIEMPNCPIASSPATFYGKKLNSANYPAPSTPVLGRTPLTLQRFSRKIKKSKAAAAIEPPVVLTLSSDDEGQEAEDEENTNENGLPSGINSEDQNHTVSITASSNEGIPDNEAADSQIQSTVRPLSPATGTINFHCRLRIGSYKVKPKDPVIVCSDYFFLKIPVINNENNLATVMIKWADILSVMTYFGHDLPALFFYLNPSCASNIRSRLWMNDKTGPFYDPSCDDELMKRLIMLPDPLDETTRTYLTKMLADVSAAHSCEDVFHKRISKAKVNNLLILSSPQEAIGDFDRLTKRSTTIFQAQKKLARAPVIRHSLRIENQRRECVTLVTYPPPPEVGGIEVTSEDIRCLVPGEFLNDVIIDFYLKYLFGEKLSADDQKRTHIFSSFFYKRLTNSDMPSENESRKDLVKTNGNKALSIAESRHSRVKNWTRNVNIFSKDYVIIPINENSHWFLVVICFAHLVGLVGDEESCPPPSAEHDYESDIQEEWLYGDNNLRAKADLESLDISASSAKSAKEECGVSKRPCILIFDSLRTHSSWSHVFRLLREYLTIEYQHKMHSKREFSKETIRASYPIVPQQTNYSDCGIFVLQYVESFFKHPIQDFQPPIRGVDTWFSSDEVCKNKRKEVEELIMRMRREQAEQCRMGNAASASGKS